MNADVLSHAAELSREGVACALCTVVRTTGSVPRRAGSKMLAGGAGELLAGTIGGGEMEARVLALAVAAIAEGSPRTTTYQLADPASGDPGVCGGTVEVFIEPLLDTPQLLVVGAGHVGRALVQAAKACGFRVLLLDDRPGMCTPEACPGADRYLPGQPAEVIAGLALGPHTYVALLTRGYPMDVEILPALLASKARYVGVIGSRRRWLTTRAALVERGIPEELIARVHAPIGLEISAETPAEIAVSIVAELIQARRG